VNKSARRKQSSSLAISRGTCANPYSAKSPRPGLARDDSYRDCRHSLLLRQLQCRR
jgi:hypothetical protein